MAVLEGFKESIHPALVGAFGLAGAVFFGTKVAGLCSSRSYRRSSGRAALAPPPPAIGTDFSYCIVCHVGWQLDKETLPHR
jgi:hypothetical protein